MKATFVFKRREADRRTRSMAVLVLSILLLQTSIGFTSATYASQRAPKKSGKFSGDQRVAHVLSRLTFGARPGDFERVKAMGVEAFINQQLDPDSIDNSSVIAKLRRLPTLGMATPVIIEQYTPPKPVVTPSPAPAMPIEKTAVSSTLQIGSDRTNADRMSALPAAAMQSEMNPKQEEAGKMPAFPADKVPAVGAVSPKPTPPPKNPQMVVTE